jgi:hypothetical protein
VATVNGHEEGCFPDPLDEGFDDHFVDRNGYKKGDAAFVGPTYGPDCEDRHGLLPGQHGYTTPADPEAATKILWAFK